MRFIGKLVLGGIGKLIGGKVASRRRERLVDEITNHGLSEDDLRDLAPYIEAAVEEGAKLRLGYVAVGCLLGLGFILIGISGMEGSIMVGGFFALLGVGLVFVTIREFYLKGYKKAKNLERILRSDPQRILEEQGDEYEHLVERIDYEEDSFESIRYNA